MSEIAIVTEKLTRRFGGVMAVDGVDMQVAAGQYFGFLGPNGAGKSTTIKMLTGLLAPSSGRMQLLGLDFSRHMVDVKRQIGVVPEVFFSSRRRHTRFDCDWSSDVCSSD